MNAVFVSRMKRMAALIAIGVIGIGQPVAAADPSATATLVTLGTGGGPVIRTERSRPANAIIVNGDIYLFDIGAGTQTQIARAGLNPARVRAVFLSHLHIDHVADVGPFIINRWLLYGDDPLPLLGPQGTRGIVTGVARMARPTERAPVTIGGQPRPRLSRTVAATEFDNHMHSPQQVYQDQNIRVWAVENDHYHFEPGSDADRYARSYTFRIEAPGRTIVYTGDTGWSQRVVDLAKGADILLSEVIDLAGVERAMRAHTSIPEAALPPLLAHMQQDHLTPREVGELAKAAGVKQVILTHLVPGDDGEEGAAAYRDGVAAVFGGPVIVANDLDRF